MCIFLEPGRTVRWSESECMGGRWWGRKIVFLFFFFFLFSFSFFFSFSSHHHPLLYRKRKFSTHTHHVIGLVAAFRSRKRREKGGKREERKIKQGTTSTIKNKRPHNCLTHTALLNTTFIPPPKKKDPLPTSPTFIPLSHKRNYHAIGPLWSQKHFEFCEHFIVACKNLAMCPTSMNCVTLIPLTTSENTTHRH